MIRTLILAIKDAFQIRKFYEVAEREEFWQPIDGKAFVGFMITPAGKKLRARLSNMVFKSAVQACAVTENGDYARGIARGVLLAVKALDQHLEAAKLPEQEDFTESHGVNSDTSGLVEALR